MNKRTNQAVLKGTIDMNLSALKSVVEEAGYQLEDLLKITVTKVVKEAEYVYDAFELMQEFNEKYVEFTFKQETDLDTIDE